MSRTLSFPLLAGLTCLALALGPAVATADSSARTWFEDQLSYLGVSPEEGDPARLAQWWAQASDSSGSAADRRSAFERLLVRWIDLHGAADQFPEGPPTTMLDRVDEILGMASPPPVLPEGTGNALQSAVTTGDGGPPIVLIEGLPSGALAPLAEILAADHRVLRVGLPGLDGGAPLPRPERRRFADRAWSNAFQEDLMRRLASEQWSQIVLVGHDLGAVAAAELAIRLEDRVEAVVLIDPRNPNMPFADHEGRLAVVESTLLPLLPPPDLDSRVAAGSVVATSWALDPALSERIARARAEVDPRVSGRWSNEASTLDYGSVLRGLGVPSRLFLSLADESSIRVATPLLTGQIWGRAAALHPEAAFAIVPFDDVRSAPLDATVTVARAVEDLLAGRQPSGTPHDPLRGGNPASRYAYERIGLGYTEVSIEYYAPAVGGRDLWGALVPWDQVWRAGANDSTRITFSHDVVLGDEPLAAGTYSFYLVPRKSGPWTAIVHSVAWGYGAFGYDERYDRVRLEVSPRPAARWFERLDYRLDQLSNGRGELVVGWGDTELALPLLAEHGLQMIDQVPTARWKALGPWTELATDVEGDQANQPALHDGVALAATFECATRTVWFRFTLASAPSERSIGLNVAVDRDLDQSNGMAWFVPDADFNFDRLITLWVDGADGEFGGLVGGSEHDAVSVGRYTELFEGGLELGLDPGGKAIYWGVPASRLDDDERMAISATVGTHQFWNDDLTGRGGVELDLGALRAPCSR